MVVAQPYLPREFFTAQEPYQFVPDAKQRQLMVLRDTLAVARHRRSNGFTTQFTILPEYGIPGLDGVRALEDGLRCNDWPPGSVLLGGTDGLTRTQYAELLQGDQTHVDVQRNGSDRVDGDEWVNCGITWIKCADGTLERWIQPKLYPAWEEQNTLHQRMFRGGSIYIFKGRLDNGAHFLFGTLVCFDWVADVESQKPFQWILADIHQRAGDGQLPLTWLFVIQRNRKPSHHAFLTSIHEFFNQNDFPNADRHNACLVFANSAGRCAPGPAQEFGASSVVLSPRALFTEPTCHPTFSTGGPRVRGGSDILRAIACKDVFFREQGECIHSFTLVNPAFLVGGAANRTVAVETAAVFPIAQVSDPRAPGAPVPAVVKWLNDALDDVPRLPRSYNPPLAGAIDDSQTRTIEALRSLSSKEAAHTVTLSAQESTTHNPDAWARDEIKAIRHLVHTLTIVGVDITFHTVGVAPTHASTVLNGREVDVVAIRGASHEECLEHLQPYLLRSPRSPVLLVSRDPENILWHPRLGSILDPVPPRPSDDRKFTDPTGSPLQLGYQNLLTIVRLATAATGIVEGIHAQFTQ